MKTKIDFGKIDGYGNGRKTCRVTVEVELNDKDVFSASADVWNNLETDIIMGGQCLDDIYPHLKNNSKFKKIYDWWKEWHLNDMHAGTEKQESALEQAGLTGWANNYTECCKYLESIGLLIDDDYVFGTGWLKRVIPSETLLQMKQFIEEN